MGLNKVLIAIIVLSMIVYGALSVYRYASGGFKLLRGDEPHYLITIKSMVEDGDFLLENNYLNPKPEAETWPYGMHVRIGVDGHFYSTHGIGLALLLSPSYKVGGLIGCFIVMSIISTLVNAFIFKICFSMLKDTKAALISSLAFGFSTPILTFSNKLFPELPMALIVLICFYLSMDISSITKSFLMGLLLGFSLFLKEAYALIALVFIIYVLSRLMLKKEFKKLVGFIVPFSILLILLMLYFYSAFNIPITTLQEFKYGNLINGSLGLLWDGRYGLFIYAPIAYLSFYGVVEFLKHQKVKGIIAIILFLIFYALVSLWAIWWGGWSPPARLILPVLPLLSFPFSYLIKNNLKKFWFKTILLLFFLIGFMLNFVITITNSLSRRKLTDFPFIVLKKLIGVDLSFLIPSFTNDYKPIMPNELSLMIISILSFMIIAIMIFQAVKRNSLNF